MAAKLTLADIADLRAYEREREDFRRRVIALKNLRRVSVGPVVSMVFENADTIRFQIQEMARAERMLTDEAIQAELDTYNPLIPEPGQLCATLFVELTSRAELERWLPRLVGVERSVELRIGAPQSVPGGGSDGREVVHCVVEEAHAAQLTREEVTASVHYVRFELDQPQVECFAAQPVQLAISHPNYLFESPLGGKTKASLLDDLRG